MRNGYSPTATIDRENKNCARLIIKMNGQTIYVIGKEGSYYFDLKIPTGNPQQKCRIWWLIVSELGSKAWWDLFSSWTWVHQVPKQDWEFYKIFRRSNWKHFPIMPLVSRRVKQITLMKALGCCDIKLCFGGLCSWEEGATDRVPAFLLLWGCPSLCQKKKTVNIYPWKQHELYLTRRSLHCALLWFWPLWKHPGNARPSLKST